MTRGGGSWKPQCWVILCFSYQKVPGWSLPGCRLTGSLPPSCLIVGQDHRPGGAVGNPFGGRQSLGMNPVWIQCNCMLVHRNTGTETLGEASQQSACWRVQSIPGAESWLPESLHCCSYNKHFTQPTDKILVWTYPSAVKCNLSFAGQEVTSRSVNQELLKMLRISRDHHPHV